MSIYRNQTNSANKPFFGQFYYGLLCGLIFGFVISALIAWVISSKNIPQPGSKNDKELSNLIKQNQTSQNSTPSFDFYNKIVSQPSIDQPDINGVGIQNVIEGSLNQDQNFSTENGQTLSKNPKSLNNVSSQEQSILLKTVIYDKVESIEELKAQLALMGYIPTIIEDNSGYSLQLGPFRTKIDAQKLKAELGELGNSFNIE